MKSLVIAAFIAISSSSAIAEIDPKLFAHDASIHETFPGPQGWTGYVLINPKGVKTVVWETDKGVTVVGRLFDRRMRDLTSLAEQEFQTAHLKVNLIHPLGVPEHRVQEYNTKSNAEIINVYDKVAFDYDESDYLITGEGEHDLYVFWDYRCVYCARLKKQLDDRTDVTVHWIPVGYVSQDSVQYGAAVLDRQIPFDHIAPKSQINGNAPTPSPKAVESVIYNTALLLKASPNNSLATPATFFKRKNNEVVMLPGNPKKATLDELLGG